MGIRVMGLAPGLIETDIHAKGGDPDRVARLGGSVPMGRAGSAEEIANAVLWLMSDEASYITGSTLNVTGGR
jgi:NAD(P)-dependent dehydrogenase (short-subunit alcohol dehydrogenase family)